MYLQWTSEVFDDPKFDCNWRISKENAVEYCRRRKLFSIVSTVWFIKFYNNPLYKEPVKKIVYIADHCTLLVTYGIWAKGNHTGCFKSIDPYTVSIYSVWIYWFLSLVLPVDCNQSTGKTRDKKERKTIFLSYIKSTLQQNSTLSTTTKLFFSDLYCSVQKSVQPLSPISQTIRR